MPQYSALFENEAEFIADTERLFDESPSNRLETKISKIKEALTLLLRTVQSSDDIKVSFSVFEGIK